MEPTRKKPSKFLVELMEQEGGFAIGEAEFNMVDFDYGQYKQHELTVKIHSDINEILKIESASINIAIRGTKKEGLIKERILEQNKLEINAKLEIDMAKKL